VLGRPECQYFRPDPSSARLLKTKRKLSRRRLEHGVGRWHAEPLAQKLAERSELLLSQVAEQPSVLRGEESLEGSAALLVGVSLGRLYITGSNRR
jgi:hypothetical protein